MRKVTRFFNLHCDGIADFFTYVTGVCGFAFVALYTAKIVLFGF